MTASNNAWSAGGGGACDQADQQRWTVRQGSGQLCTWRSARGQDGGLERGGEELVGAGGEVAGGWGSPFSPHSRRLGERERGSSRDGDGGRRPTDPLGGRLAFRPPAETEGTADQRPMPADSAGGAHLEIGPDQVPLDRRASPR